MANLLAEGKEAKCDQRGFLAGTFPPPNFQSLFPS